MAVLRVSETHDHLLKDGKPFFSPASPSVFSFFTAEHAEHAEQKLPQCSAVFAVSAVQFRQAQGKKKIPK